MDQAQLRRLRMSALLLFPLLMASTPPSSETSLPTLGFETTGIPSQVSAGIAFKLVVTARNASGVDVGYAGTIHISSTDPRALMPPDYTFQPAVDLGTKEFLITLLSPGQWELRVEDVNDTSIHSQFPNVPVTTGAPVHFEFTLDPSPTAGQPYTFQVLPLDSAGNVTNYSGTLHFETTVASAAFTSDFTGTVDAQLPQFSITFFSADPLPKTLTVTDVSSGQRITGSTSITVQHGQLHHVTLSTAAPNPTPTCTEVTIELSAKDAWENPISDVPYDKIGICKPSNSSAHFVSSTLVSASNDSDCVTGTLKGSALVTWKNEVPEDVGFIVSGSTSPEPLTIHWRAGLPSPTNSNLSFRESAETTPTLQSDAAPLTLQFVLRDQCGQPAVLPADKSLSFAADSPLLLASPVQENPGQWTVAVSLPKCTIEPSKSLAVWPLINNESLNRTNGQRVQRLVLPQCLPIVLLDLLSPAEELVAEPGASVEFDVQVTNDDDPLVSDGVLKLEPTGLTVLGASINSQSLSPQEGGFVLPELHKGSPVTVKISAQATTQPDPPPMSTLVWVAHQDGALLTEKKTVEFKRAGLGADVGCGCHATSLPSQLFPWLALLLAASRPWDRLRRLRLGERNDR